MALTLAPALQLHLVQPDGSFGRYRACAVGAGAGKATASLEQDFGAFSAPPDKLSSEGQESLLRALEEALLGREESNGKDEQETGEASSSTASDPTDAAETRDQKLKHRFLDVGVLRLVQVSALHVLL